MRWLIEGGGDGHDIHLQVPIVLRSIFHVQLKTRFWSCIDLVPGSFTSSCESPGLCIPTPPLYPQNFFFLYFSPTFSQIQFLYLCLATSALLRAKSKRRGHGSWGGQAGTSLPHDCRGADLGGLEPTTKTHLEEPGMNWDQEHLWIILPPFSLRKLCSLCPLAPSFFYYTLM